MKLKSKSETPIRTSYHLETGVSPELGKIDDVYYQLLIGVIRCIVDIFRVDI